MKGDYERKAGNRVMDFDTTKMIAPVPPREMPAEEEELLAIEPVDTQTMDEIAAVEDDVATVFEDMVSERYDEDVPEKDFVAEETKSKPKKRRGRKPKIETDEELIELCVKVPLSVKKGIKHLAIDYNTTCAKLVTQWYYDHKPKGAADNK